MIFYIIGWIFVAWLALSTIYSTWYHLRNYYSAGQSETIIARDLDARGEIKELNRKEFLRKVLQKQIYKIVIIIIVLYFLIY